MMVQRYWMIAVAVLVTGLVGWQAYGLLYPPKTNLKLVFHAQVGADKFQRNAFIYDNPGGEGRFRIRDFRFYMSNFRLNDGGTETVTIPDSYHLARFDNDENAYVLEFKDLSIQQLEDISFAIGIDAVANTSIQSRGDLDPNSQMAWNWKVGYKFVVFEGSMQLNDQHRPLVYHVGFSENMRRLNYALPDPLALSETSQLEFAVDVMKLFDSNSTVDMAQLSSVKFDKNDTRMLAENYRTMISLQTQ